MKEIKALVLCSSRFAMPCIQQLQYAKILCAVAVSNGMDEAAENAEAILKGSGTPVIRLKDDFEEELKNIIKEKEINLCLVLTFSRKIPSAVYTLPGLGSYNFHPGPLPLYRGPDPIFQQLKRREKNAGIVIHKLDDNFDTGPVVMKEMVAIAPGDTYGMLTTKLSMTAVKMLGVLLKMLVMEIAPPAAPQRDQEATYFKKQDAEEVRINWGIMEADEIIALMNACNPWNKGAVTMFNNMVIRLPEGKKNVHEPGETSVPGTILDFSDAGMKIATLKGESITVPFLFIDEGFFNAGRLQEFGMITGSILSY